MFWFTEPSSGQIQNTIPVHSASTHTMGSHSVCTCWMYWYCVLYLAWWWFSEPKHVTKFSILITKIYCVIDWINYCIIAQHNGMATIKIWDNQPSDSHCLLMLPLRLLGAFCCVYLIPMNKYVTAGFYISTCMGETHSVIKHMRVLEKLV
jgi:hypothetical protein